ncbi:hypothetical protein CMI44_00735 [Candidatus Pacearchaeota archaeon]|jgi:hypothetical protein|nr:hypothetical protein [Candidatus Pacearchaeota archaeon]
MREGKGKTGISIKMDERDARDVTNNFCFNERYLKNLVRMYAPNADPTMDYRELRRHGYVIRGIAKKILKKSEKDKIPKQLSLFQ